MFSRTFGCIILLGATASSVCGQSSTAAINANPRAQYEILKAAMVESNLVRPDLRDTNPNIRLCGTEVMPVGDDLTARLMWLAQQVHKASQYLTWTGYPQPLWQPLVADYERVELSRIIDQNANIDDPPEADILIRKLSDYRASAATRLPAIDWIPCGGGADGLFKIRTIPADGEVWAIPAVFHALCEKQKLDADDRDQCNYGESYLDGDEVARLNGQYRYVVTWPGGKRKKGAVSFDKVGRVWTVK
jgi:hypothetical protein